MNTEAQFSIKPESAALAPRVELLLDRVFGAERREKASYLFREGVAPVQALSWAALKSRIPKVSMDTPMPMC